MSIKTNVIYNSLLTVCSYIASFIVFPYVSRILGVSNIGITGFVDNTINYFVVFTSLGISLIGTREIALCGNDRNKRSQVYSSLLIIILILTIIVSIIYFIAINTVARFIEYKKLFLIGYAKLISLAFLIQWLYNGVEDFKYIALRNIAIQLTYVLAVFVFIKQENDLILYYTLTTITVFLNFSVNILYSKKYVSFCHTDLTIKQYIKPILILGARLIFSSMYTTFNVMYLGLVSSEQQVGYYYTATKIYIIMMQVFVAFNGVMLPRMSAVNASEDKEVYNSLINKSFEFLLAICLPLSIGGVVLAPQMINLLSGPGYEGAIIPMRIIMPLLIIVGITEIMTNQVLLPKRQDKTILYACCIGAFVGVVTNFLLVKKYGSEGSAIVLLLSQFAVTIYYVVISLKRHYFDLNYHLFKRNIIIGIPYIFFCIVPVILLNSIIFQCVIPVLFSIIYFSFTQKKIVKYLLPNKKIK